MPTLTSMNATMPVTNSRPYRVLQLVDSLERGGIETWLLNMLRSVPRSDFILDVCCKGKQSGSLTQVATELGAQVHHVAMRKRPLSFSRSLSELITREKYDLLHSHVNSHNGLAVRAARLAEVPVVATFHNERLIGRTKWTELPGLNALTRRYCEWSVQYSAQHAQVIAPVSNAVLEALRGYAELADERTQVLYLGANTPAELDEDDRLRLRSALSLAADAPVLLHVGSFTAQKNHRDILAIYQEVKRTRTDAQLLLVGDGPERAFVETEISHRKIPDVHLLGLRDDVGDLMSVSDVFLLPSLHEGLPIVLMEAAAAALPAVASDIPSIAEAINDGETGFLVPVGDVTQFSRKVLRLFEDPALKLRVGDAAKKDYRQRFSLESSANRLAGLYSRVLRS